MLFQLKGFCLRVGGLVNSWMSARGEKKKWGREGEGMSRVSLEGGQGQGASRGLSPG